MPEREDIDLVNEMRPFIQRQFVAGFDSLSSICESAVEAFCDDVDEAVVRPVAERLTKEIAAAELQQQTRWPALTDCDRVDDAFAELNCSGIVARQNFSCCGNCGVAEIGDEIQAESTKGVAVCGSAFCPMQDTESAAEGCGLYLNYGSVEGDAAETQHVGQQVVEVLQRHGLAIRWDGSIANRIHVRLNWQRRRPLEIDVAEPER